MRTKAAAIAGSERRAIRRSPAAAVPPSLRRVLAAAERFRQVIEARATAPLLKFDLTMPEMRAVFAIQRGGRVNGRQLATLLGLTPSAIVALCDRLEAKGYVRRVSDDADRRITWFVLTDTGMSRLADAASDFGGAVRMLRARVSRLRRCEQDGFVKIATAFSDALGRLDTPETGEPTEEKRAAARRRRRTR